MFCLLVEAFLPQELKHLDQQSKMSQSKYFASEPLRVTPVVSLLFPLLDCCICESLLWDRKQNVLDADSECIRTSEELAPALRGTAISLAL